MCVSSCPSQQVANREVGSLVGHIRHPAASSRRALDRGPVTGGMGKAGGGRGAAGGGGLRDEA